MSGIHKLSLCVAFVFAVGAPSHCVAAPSASGHGAGTSVKATSGLSVDQVRRWNRDGFEAYERDDIARALASFGHAARAGDPSAQYNVALIRLRDESRTPSLGRALRLLRRSADAGFAPAQVMLASFYDAGRFVERSVTSAFEWNLRAAEQGNIDAALALATHYFLGRGTAQNYPQAAL